MTTLATENPQSTATSTVALTRNEIIARRAESGEDLTAIGTDYQMSRERVRQIVSKTSTKSNDEIREARRANREQARAEREAAKVALVRQVAAENPDAPLATLADLTGFAVAVVRDALDWTDRERRGEAQSYPSLPDEAVLAEIRRVAALPGGQPLTGTFYDANRDGGLSHARLLQRFKTWTGACEAAGVTPRGPNPGRVYTRGWTTEEMTQWVWNYLSATERPSYARFEAWLRERRNSGAPSAQTVRNSLGSWVEMKRLAITNHAAASN